jgi:hypothetical protein
MRILRVLSSWVMSKWPRNLNQIASGKPDPGMRQNPVSVSLDMCGQGCGRGRRLGGAIQGSFGSKVTPDETATPQIASGATSTSSAALTDAEKQRKIEVALPNAIASITATFKSAALDAAELADIMAALSALGRKDTRYVFRAIADQPNANATGELVNGRGRITINPNSKILFNADGTVNMTTLSAVLIHEGRHIYDARLYGGRNPSTVEQVRRTERSAYRTQAAYLKAVGGTMYTRDLTRDYVPLTGANANIAAENSVKSWTTAEAKNAADANVITNRNNIAIKRYNEEVIQYNRSTGNKMPLKPLEIMRPIPVYTPPNSY